MHIVAFIFARGGSKGIKNKNLLKFKNSSLLGNTIILANKIKKIKQVFVSSDNKKIIKEALKHKAKVPFVRPSKLSKDNSPEILSWKHAINFLNKKLKLFPDYIVSLPTTSPLRNKEDINSCLNLAIKKNLDIVFTISESQKNPFFNMLFKKNKKEFVKFNEIIKTKFLKKNYFRRQEAPEVFDITTVCYVFKPSYILRSKSLFDGKIGYVKIPKDRALDIDDAFDYKIARLLSKNEKK